MATYYSKEELKQLALSSAQLYSSSFTQVDAENAYSFASARCGFENPANTDTDYVVKQHWLIEMMKLWFYKNIRDQYLLKFDVGDLKLSQAVKNIREVISSIEDSFAKAREEVGSAHVFAGAEPLKDTVAGNGLTDDAVGQDYRS